MHPALSNLVKDGRHILLAGPTASGKSALALHAAQLMHTTIINADSVQLYKGMPLLTAAPSLLQKGKAKHELYAVLKPNDPPYSAASWTAHCHAIIKKEKKPCWIAGGTGFYFSSLTKGLSPIPDLDPMEKTHLRNHYASYTHEELLVKLYSVDPFFPSHITDRQRVTHALIVQKMTQKPLSYWHSQKKKVWPLSHVKVLIWPSMESLMKRALSRWNEMKNGGVFEEVDLFCKQHNWETSMLRKAIGFSLIRDVLKGNLTQEICTERYLQATSAYIKRQRTWFRHQFFSTHCGNGPGIIIPHIIQ